MMIRRLFFSTDRSRIQRASIPCCGSVEGLGDGRRAQLPEDGQILRDREASQCPYGRREGQEIELVDRCDHGIGERQQARNAKPRRYDDKHQDMRRSRNEAHELALKAGISRDAVRFYERMGLIASTRTRNGYREFPDDMLQQLLYVRTAQSLGFSLAEIGSGFAQIEATRSKRRQLRSRAAAAVGGG